jgi:hypothetical protein
MKCKDCGVDIGERYSNGRSKRFCPPCRKEHGRLANKRKREIGIKSGVLFGRPLIEVIYDRYRKGAEKRGYAFELSLEQFRVYWQKPCTYCGDEIETIGVDRINNDLGYIEGNTAPCCTRCNLTKRGMLPEDYIALCTKVARKWMGGFIKELR